MVVSSKIKTTVRMIGSLGVLLVGATSLPGQKIDRDQVTAFVSHHDTRLASILTHLEQSRPLEFAKAISDLGRTTRRIRQFENKDKRRFELELESWKLQTSIQLLAARMRMQPSDGLADELRGTLAKKLDVRAELLTYLQGKMTQRAARIDEQLKKLAENRSEMIEKQLRALSAAKKKSKPGKNLKTRVSDVR